MSQQDVSALNDQAFSLLGQGDRDAAKEVFERVCELDEREPEARMMLGAIHAELGNLEKAEDYLQRALAIDEKYSDAYFYLANVTRAKGDNDAALNLLERSIEIDPDFNDARVALYALLEDCANSSLQREDVGAAITYFEKLAGHQPEKASNWFHLGRSYGQKEMFTEAVESIEKALSIDPDMVEAHFILVAFLLSLGRTDEATYHCDRALELDPDNINAIAMAANLAKRVGDPERAYRMLNPLLERGLRDINIVLAFSMVSSDLGREQEAADMIEQLLADDHSLKTDTRSNLYFNLGRLYDSLKRYDDAFTNYQKGNELKKVVFDRDEFDSTIEKNIAVFSEQKNKALPVSSVRSGRPVFVVGMVRSGTSLVEQILASHPDVFGAGELGDIYYYSLKLPGIVGSGYRYPGCMSLVNQSHLDDFANQYLQHLAEISQGEKKVIDKLPGNFMYLGIIEKLFPDARVIHCMRDPVDTCLSAYFQNFTGTLPYAYKLEDLAFFYKGYRRLMEHWKGVLDIPILDIDYEDMITDQEKMSRSMVEFCGLEWDDRCLEFHKSKRFVKTASYDQVNRPVYSRSVARWKNYEAHIEALLAGLGQV